MSRTSLSETAYLAGRSIHAEQLAARIARSLADAGVDALVIKGPVTERWLYGAGELRTIGDVDVVADPSHYRRAEQVLLAAGFVNRYDGVAPDWTAEHGDRWVSDDWALPIDLHRRLWGFGAGPDRVWARLWAERVQERFAGGAGWVPGEAARVLLLALHAAHHGTAEKSIEDLRRAEAGVSDDVWAEAAALARELEAAEGFAAGLELLPNAADVRARLDLLDVDARMADTHTDMWDAAPTAAGFVRLAATPGARPKLRLLRRELLPSPRFMRQMSEERELARRGRLGLLASYAVRWASLLRNAARGIVDARKLRR
jgi:putative nucleotidyltransferase-like protein